MKRIVLLALCTLGLAAFSAVPALASHESNNSLSFAPVAASLSPQAEGSGVINYVKGRSGAEPNTTWTSSFHYSGLTPSTRYTVVVRGRFADPAAFSGICTFTTNAQGNGSCHSRFTGLQRLAIAQLRIGGESGAPVLQATRQAVASGPGTIVSRGGCREPDQTGSTCTAPGRR